MVNSNDHSSILEIERPDAKLMTYYFITCLLTGPFFFFLILPAYFRFHTMRYKIGDEGVSMRWGILFRKEIILNYARIQDIHLSSNVIERWLGLARLQIQTASGSSSAEMTIEGVLEFEALRDFLYSKMRGLKHGQSTPLHSAGGTSSAIQSSEAMEVAELLRSATQELRLIREHLSAQSADRQTEPPRPPDLPTGPDA